MTKVGSRAFSLASQAGGHPSPNLQPPAKPPRGRSPPFLLPRYWQLESKRQCKPEIADRHNRAFHNQIRESPALSFLNPYQPHSLTSTTFSSTFAELLPLCVTLDEARNCGIFFHSPRSHEFLPVAKWCWDAALPSSLVQISAVLHFPSILPQPQTDLLCGCAC